MSVRFRIKHHERIAGTVIIYRVDIEDSSYGGAIKKKKASKRFFIWDYPNLDPRNLFEDPLQNASLQINFAVQEAEDQVLLDDILDADEDRFKAKFYIDGDHKWTGRILTDLMRYPQAPRPYTSKIKAKDISGLDAIDYELVSSASPERLSVIIADCLKETGLTLPLRSFTNITNSELSDTSLDFLYNVHHQKYALRDQNKAMSRRDVLVQICRAYNLIIRQSDARWIIEQFTAVAKGDAVQFDYDSDGLNPTSSTPSRTVSVSDQDKFIIPGSENKVRGALKRVRSKYNHQTWIVNLDPLDDVTHDDLNDETIIKSGTLPDGSLRFRFSVDVTMQTSNTGNAATSGNAFLDIIGFRPAGQTDLSYDQNSNSFTSATTETEVALSWSSGEPIGELTGSLEITIDGSTPLDPGIQNIYVILKWGEAFDNGGSSSGITIDQIDYKNLEGLVYSDIRDWQALTVHEQQRTGNYTLEETIEETVLGDGPTDGANLVSRGRPMDSSVANGSNVLATGKYKIRGESSSKEVSLEQLRLRERLAVRRKNLRMLRARLWAKFSPESKISYDGDTWFFLGGRLDVRGSRWKASLVRLTYQRDDANDTYSTSVDEGGAPSGESVSSGASTTGTSDHGELAGLGDDDHTQYLLVDGSRAMTGNLDMGSNNMTNVAGISGAAVGSDVQAFDQGLKDIADLADPNTDSVLGWDDSAGAFEFLTAAELSGLVDHDQTVNFVANEHINHSSVTLTAGTGLSGGGDLTASRTFNVTGVLEDLDTLGAATADGQFIVATGAGAFGYESDNVARTSLGLGTSDSPTFAGGTFTGKLLYDVNGEAIKVKGGATGASLLSWIQWDESDGTRAGYIGFGSSGNTDFQFRNDIGAFNFGSLLTAQGGIGITGTSDFDASAGIFRFNADSASRGAIRFTNDVGSLWDIQIRDNEDLRFNRQGGSGVVRLDYATVGNLLTAQGGIQSNGRIDIQNEYLIIDRNDGSQGGLIVSESNTNRYQILYNPSNNYTRWRNNTSSEDIILHDSGGGEITTSFDVSGLLTAQGGATINNTDLTVNSGIDLNGDMISSGKSEGDNFVTGFQGADALVNYGTGDAEFEDVLIRGGLQVSELILNQLRYQDGGLAIGHGGGKVANVPTATQGSEVIELEDPSGNDAQVFTAGSILLIQRFDLDSTTVIKKIVREVVSVNTAASPNQYTLTTTTGWGTVDDTGAISAGDEIVAIGHSSDTSLDSILYMSAVDSNNPFLRIMDGVDNYNKFDLSAGTALRLQLGNLNGVYGYSSEIYGIGAGDPGGEFFTVDPTNGVRFLDGADSNKVLGQFSGQVFSFGDVSETDDYIKFDNTGASVTVGMSLSAAEIDATEVYISSSNKRVAVGADGSAVTVANSTAGTVMGDTGFKSYLDADNYIRRDGTNLDIASKSFTLTSTILTVSDTAFSLDTGGGFKSADLYLDSSAGDFSIADKFYYDKSATELGLTGTLLVRAGSDITNSVGDFSITNSGFSIRTGTQATPERIYAIRNSSDTLVAGFWSDPESDDTVVGALSNNLWLTAYTSGDVYLSSSEDINLNASNQINANTTLSAIGNKIIADRYEGTSTTVADSTSEVIRTLSSDETVFLFITSDGGTSGALFLIESDAQTNQILVQSSNALYEAYTGSPDGSTSSLKVGVYIDGALNQVHIENKSTVEATFFYNFLK